EAESQLIASNVDSALIVSPCNLVFILSRIERCPALILDLVGGLTKPDIFNIRHKQRFKFAAPTSRETSFG
ncbi:hypothetical protein OAF56_05170, partial [Pirellulaceae bacterium]|nr:hypothetical protein [Pirellulaceae bacterium]